MQLFTGLSAFPLTPADEHGSVDTGALARLVDRMVAAQVDSIGLLGSTGIYAYLTRDERRRAIQAASKAVNGKLPLIVGVGALRTDLAVALAQDAANEGADALLLAPVSYTPLKEDEVYQLFETVAGTTGLPLCIYNNPGTTHFTFSAALLERLAVVPNIKAVKMPLPTKVDIAAELQNLRSGEAQRLAIGYSGDWGIADAMLAGADGFYSGIAGVLPREIMLLARAAQAGDDTETQRINDSFQPLWVLAKQFGGLRLSYTIAKLLGICDAKLPLPILGLQPDDERRTIDALAAIKAAIG